MTTRQANRCLPVSAHLPVTTVFRASASAILQSDPGDEITSSDLSTAVGEVFPSAYNDATLAKIGRNTASSWEQTGHLEAGCAQREAAASTDLHVGNGGVRTAARPARRGPRCGAL